MYEPYGHHDWTGFPTQPDARTLRPAPDPEQHTGMGYSPLGTAQENGAWDPAEELACLLQGSMGDQTQSFDRVVFDEVTDAMSTTGLVAGPLGTGPAEASAGHRRRTVRAKAPAVALMRTGSLCTSLLVALIAAVVSIFSGLAICDALRHSAVPHTGHDVVSWWPLLIYGPWMVASLSILRAALHQRRAVHSWSIVLLFSTLATLLCVAQAPRTLPAQAAATLPAIAALACFQQLVRQITLTRPPRQQTPRHRNSRPSPAPRLHYGA
ncbi:hypothetical protein K7B10_22820 [Streptomyces flavotricini]|uniref:DUF2637 domain-containing protein n=2 Tax=Streptomyces TaxID=1883 RepID=A0ABS8E973_9ACTN|nr:hypothetical protein [Streptomyces flavotricini]